MTVGYKEYMNEKIEFISKHDHDFIVDTSPMDDYGVYYKTYIFADGAVWYEKMSPVVESGIAEIHGCRCKVEVEMLRTEFWSTETASKFYYEQF